MIKQATPTVQRNHKSFFLLLWLLTLTLRLRILRITIFLFLLVLGSFFELLLFNRVAILVQIVNSLQSGDVLEQPSSIVVLRCHRIVDKINFTELFQLTQWLQRVEIFDFVVAKNDSVEGRQDS